MAFIYSSSSGTQDDGRVYKTGQSSWANARDATSGSGSSTSQSFSSYFTGVVRNPGRGGGSAYAVYRSFIAFDTSGINTTVDSASINIRGYNSNDGSVIPVKSNAYGGDGGTSLASGDFDAIVGWSAGSSLDGLATTYGPAKTTTNWSTSGYNSFTGTSDLLTDMKNNDVVIICFMDYTNDYLNVEPASGSTLNCGGFFAEYTGQSIDPKILYTLAAGYTNTVNGVAPGDISEVKGIATADISEIIGI
tara:strand:- start:613 stop:1356 length:744 start_codon:yes stop_codon:yes gene_type:complete